MSQAKKNFHTHVYHQILRPFTKILRIAFVSRILATKNTTSRLKAVSRSFDTDRWHKKPHISFSEGLPVELLKSIASCLPLIAAASFNTGIIFVRDVENWLQLTSAAL